MNSSKQGADLLKSVSSIIQRAIDSGEHGDPQDFARQILHAVEEYYSDRREGLFKKP